MPTRFTSQKFQLCQRGSCLHEAARQFESRSLARQAAQGWGAKVIERLAHDLRTAFPEMKGFSPRNLKYMRAFAEAWPDEAIVQGVLAQLPWYHQLALLQAARYKKACRDAAQAIKPW